MIIKLFNNGQIIEQGEFVSLSNSSIKVKKEEETQELVGVNWQNVSPVLYDENDNILEQETKDIIKKLYKDEAYKKLLPTDWRVIKQQETGDYSPEEWHITTAERQSIRSICDDKIGRLENCTDLTSYKVEL